MRLPGFDGDRAGHVLIEAAQEAGLEADGRAFVSVGRFAVDAELCEEIGVDVENARLGVDRAGVELQTTERASAKSRNRPVNPETLAFAEQVAVPPEGTDLRAVERRDGGRRTEEAGLAFANFERDRHTTIRIDAFALDDPDALDAFQLAQAFTRCLEVGWIKLLTRLQSALPRDGLAADAIGADDADPAVNRRRAGLDHDADVDDGAGMVCRNIAIGDAGERIAGGTPRFDDALDCRDDGAGACLGARRQLVDMWLGGGMCLRRRGLRDGNSAKMENWPRNHADAGFQRRSRRLLQVLEADVGQRAASNADVDLRAIARLGIERGGQPFDVGACACNQRGGVAGPMVGLGYKE